MPEIRLDGCTPEPLMSYLKALGVFRIVAEQADSDASLSWRAGIAHLHSKLERDELEKFFLNQYHPTPIMTPWNSASGFAPTKAGNKAPKDKAAREAVKILAESELPRLRYYREAISALRQIARNDEDPKTWKHDYFMRCRATLPDNVIGWLDTCFALTNTDLSSFPLLGSGGNDGVTDFGSLFMQRLCEIVQSTPTDAIAGWLRSSVFGEGLEPLLDDTVGQFNPGGIGGANATQAKFEAKSKVNPWDFVLMIEGALLFAGSVARRMGSNNSGDYSAFPFCVEGIVVGNGSFSDKEARERGKEPPNGGELWLPLWEQPLGYQELKHLFAEGRAQFGRRQARNAVEFGLAVSMLGVCRGIASFSRIGFLRRNGKAFLATPLGRILVRERPMARLLEDRAMLNWLDRLRSACRETDGRRDNVPARYKIALRQIDRAMFAFANRSEQGNDANDANYLLDVLAALGRAERTLATEGLSWLKNKQYGWKLSPLQGLSSQWLDQANDSVREFRLAAALAGIRADKDNKVGPFRVFLEEVEVDRFVSWLPGSKSAVWSKQPLAVNLASVFHRRQIEALRAGLAGVPLDSLRPARIADVAAFLNEEIDDDKLHDLLWGLIAVGYSRQHMHLECERVEIPFEFGVPRLLVQENCFVWNGKHWRRSDEPGVNAKPMPEVFHSLESGRQNAVGECVDWSPSGQGRS
jgi:CRISPR-associated protein Csx17